MLYRRSFSSYERYVEAQGGKSVYNKDDILQSCKNRTSGFEKIFKKYKENLRPGSVLCLGVRTGCEVFGAIKAGFTNSVGIDLFPMDDSVIKADWHNIPFDESTFDNVFTNSIDHCLDLDKMMAEVVRVLRPRGTFFLAAPDAVNKITHEQWYAAGGNEALFWEDTMDLANEFKRVGLSLFRLDWPPGKWRLHFFRNNKQ